jgi:hypothetical protein
VSTTAKLATIATFTITVPAIAGCAKNGPYGGHSMKWYEQHPAAMKAENKWCAEGQSLDGQSHGNSCERVWQAERSTIIASPAKTLGPIPANMPSRTALSSPKAQ